MAATAEKPKVKLMEKRIDWAKVGSKTLLQTFGKVGKIKDMTKTLWKIIKENDLLLD